MLTQARLKEVLHYDPETGVFTWRVTRGRNAKAGDVAGWPDRGYVRIEVAGRTYRAHRLAWLYVHGVWSSQVIDHIDGNPKNNAIANLRDVSLAVNGQNQRKPRSGSQSRHIGVNRSGARWRAQIFIGGKNKHLGLYDTPEQAHAAYLHAKRSLHEGCTL